MPVWRRSTPYKHVVGLIPSDDSLYVAAEGKDPSAVAQLDPSDGTFRWETEIAADPIPRSYSDYRSTARNQWGLTITADTIYSVHGATKAWNELHALDRSTGSERWSLREDRGLTVHGIAEETVVVLCREFFVPEHTEDVPDGPLSSRLYGIDPVSGDIRWTQEFEGVADISVADDGIYVGTSEGLVKVSPHGNQLWMLDTECPARSVRMASDRIYHLTEGSNRTSRIHGVDPDGTRQWTRTEPVSEVVLGGDRLYAGGRKVLAMEPNGSVRWVDQTPGNWFVVNRHADRLYARGRGNVVCYGLADGKIHWSYDPPNQTYAWPEVATNDTVVVQGFDEDRILYGLNSDTGEPRRRFHVGSDVALFTVRGLEDRVFLGDGNGRITALEL